ncbi:MAG: FAD-dependent oxidoreductase [Candidatus Anammoxibacter sp.]
MVTEKIIYMGQHNNLNEEAPCILGCPIQQDGRDYIQLIARRKFDEAFRIVRSRNILPSACGRICTHPCEDKCRRKDVDKSLAIAWLKRFLSDRISTVSQNKAEIKFTEKIAIIGGGPAGLAAAHDLAILGYKCTVFEATGKAGGMIGIGVPTFRLPRKEIAKDIDFIKNLGVEFRLNIKVGEDITIDDIKKEDFTAVFITVGLPLSRNLPIKGVETEGVLKGVDFLNEANSTEKVNLGEKVLVIGGGAVAMDCARTALRLGPKEVHISCLESREEMPTSDYEIEETLHEKIILHTSLGPKRIVVENGKVKGLETLKVQSVFDEQGRFNPSFHEGSEETIEADNIIIAIGQGSDLSVLNGIEGIQTTRGGTIVVNKETLMTDVSGIFAGGDVVLGRGTMTMGLEHGKKAAFTIHNFLQNESERDSKFDAIEPIPDLAQRRVELIKKEERAGMSVIEDDKRKTSFTEVELGFDEETAVREAQRCMNCGAGANVLPHLCVGCLTCVRVCPFEIPVINDDNVAYINGDCQSCGICVVECPANAIEFKGLYEDQGEDELINAIKGLDKNKSKIVNLFCHYSKLASSNTKAGIANVGVLGLCKIDPILLLHAFEKGADGVRVSVCEDESCHYGNSCAEWANRKIDTAKALLEAVGIDKDKVKVIEN